MSTSVIIADDEEFIRTDLWRICNTLPTLEVVGVCNSGDEAWSLIQSLKPDLALLDVTMPNLTGIEVAERVYKYKISTAIAFISAYKDYAVNAFAVDAIDYILKPIDENDVQRILFKYSKLVYNPQRVDASLHSYPQKIAVDIEGDVEILDASMIQLVQAQQRLIFIHTIDGRKYLGRLTLQEYANILNPSLFCRCHRNSIVNIDQISRISKWFNGGCLLTLKSNPKIELPASRSGYEKLKSLIFMG